MNLELDRVYRTNIFIPANWDSHSEIPYSQKRFGPVLGLLGSCSERRLANFQK
jgi:hypothetical protein